MAVRIAPAGSGYQTGGARVLADLTPRHRQIARLVAMGFTNRVIADHLCISDQTVKNHVTAIMDAIGLPLSQNGFNTRVLLAWWVWNQER